MGFYNPHTNQFVSSWGINGLFSSCRCVATEISRFCRTWCVLLFMQVFHETKPSTLKHSALWRLSFYDSPWLTRLSSKQATEIAHPGLYNLTLSDQSSEPFRCWDRWLSLGGALRLVQWPPRWLARHDPASLTPSSKDASPAQREPSRILFQLDALLGSLTSAWETFFCWSSHQLEPGCPKR